MLKNVDFCGSGGKRKATAATVANLIRFVQTTWIAVPIRKTAFVS